MVRIILNEITDKLSRQKVNCSQIKWLAQIGNDWS